MNSEERTWRHIFDWVYPDKLCESGRLYFECDGPVPPGGGGQSRESPVAPGTPRGGHDHHTSRALQNPRSSARRRRIVPPLCILLVALAIIVTCTVDAARTQTHISQLQHKTSLSLHCVTNRGLPFPAHVVVPEVTLGQCACDDGL